MLHFLLVREIVREVGAGLPALRRIVDLGCGTLAAGAAWALEEGGQAAVTGADVSAFAVEAARFTLRCLGLRGSVQRENLLRVRLPGRGAGIVAAFAVNELGGRERERLLGRLLEAARRGARILVVEPLALRANPWWRPWTDRFLAAGGRQDEWRFPMELPGRVALLHRAAGFRREEITGRSLWLAREPSGERPLSG